MGAPRLSALAALFLFASSLFGQTPDYLLVKTGISIQGQNPQTVTFQWVAFNNKPADENFLILLNSSADIQIRSVFQNASTVPIQNLDGTRIGPFTVAGNSSVTLQTTELVQTTKPVSGDRNLAGDKFVLLPLDAANGGSPRISSSALKATTPTPSSGQGLVQFVAAIPNISRGNQPIDFRVDLNTQAEIELSIFALTGERIYDTQVSGVQGSNSFVWTLQNGARQTAASGLYLFLLKATNGSEEQTRIGKILIIR